MFENIPSSASPRLRLLPVGSTSFGLFEDEITTVLEWSEPAPLPFAPDSVLGVACIQGRMFTVLDLARLIGTDEGAKSPAVTKSRMLVALRGDEQLALAVDSAHNSIEVFPAEIKLPGDSAGGPFLGIIEHDGSDVHILDSKKLFAAIRGNQRRRRRF
jgi:chemotaxis signal transduction protein